MGYFYLESNKKLRGIEIMENLKTKEIGSKIIVFDRLSSTNVKAKELAKNGSASGTVIIAEEQYAGRGRLGRNWHSPQGTGLWFTIILKPEVPPEKSFFFTIIASLAVCDSLKNMEKAIYNQGIDKEKYENNMINKKKGSGVEIKWPNDILIGGKKVSGILSEISLSQKINYVIVGMGINVNQKKFPEKLKETATSLSLYYNINVNRVILFKEILINFERYYFLLMNKKYNDLIKVWKENNNVIGKDVAIYSSEKAYEGKVVDISNDGRLVLKESNGNIQEFWSGDVSFKKIER